MIGRLAGIAWNAVAIFFLLSVASASLIGLVRKARARSKRLFVDRPNEVLRTLTHDRTHQHEMDVL